MYIPVNKLRNRNSECDFQSSFHVTFLNVKKKVIKTNFKVAMTFNFKYSKDTINPKRDMVFGDEKYLISVGGLFYLFPNKSIS